MNQEMKLRILVFEYEKDLATAIRDILELEDYIAIAAIEPRSAMLALNSFCPDIIVLGYYTHDTKSYKHFLERCQLNYPIAYVCTHRLEGKIRSDYFFDTQDRIIVKPFDADDMLLSLLSMQPRGKTS